MLNEAEMIYKFVKKNVMQGILTKEHIYSIIYIYLLHSILKYNSALLELQQTKDHELIDSINLIKKI